MDENKDVKQEEKAPVEGQQEEQQVQQEVDPVEAEARAGGWLPKEEFYANPANAGKKWRSAELFVELTPLYEKIDTLHKQNKTLNQGLKAFSEHNKRIEQAAYNKALAQLKAERKQALADEDFVKAEEIRDQIDALPPPQPVVEIPDPAETHPDFEAWKSQNRWYVTNEDAKLFADTYGVKLAQQGKSPQEVLVAVTQKVRQTFPQLFQNPKREAAPSFEGAPSGKGKSAGSFQLSAEETDIMNRLIKSGAPITRDEYISQLKKSRGV